MCFSATSSFIIAAALVPAGIATINSARQIDDKWLALASFPLFFGVQQAIEGMVWIGVNGNDAKLVAATSRAFLFFSHFFWLAFPPLAACAVEPDQRRRTLLAALGIFGAIGGLTVFLPTLVNPDWLKVAVVSGNLEYMTTLIYDGIVSRSLLRYAYAFIVIVSLLASSIRSVQLFGLLIFASLTFTSAVFPHAIISVWCYLAAVLSAYMVWMISHERQRHGTLRA